MWLPILLTCLAACSLKLLVTVIAQANRWLTRRRYGVAQGATMVGFFHPFCAGGGGGERLLWRAVHALSRLPKELHGPLHVLIYTGDVSMAPEAILSGVARQFEISINPAALPVSFVYLRTRGLLDAGLYPVLTMLAQSAASVVLAAEALIRATPDVFVDTTGFAFSFPLAWFAGCSVGAYVHYPTISTDMLSRVRDQRPSHNNSAWITSSVAVSRAKLLYYRAFAYLYGIAGGFFASRVMVNSNWTRGHVAALWKRSPPPTVVFPPCDTTELESLPINDAGRERCALSVGQFRPEKDHALQVRALAALRSLSASTDGTIETGGCLSFTVGSGSKAAGACRPCGDSSSYRPTSCFEDVRLVILGSCRNDGDRAVLERTRALAVELGVEERVEFVVNCSFDELKAWLGRASVGLHTMWNEHFGIGVVEMMAAGVVTIAHRSGGPLADIIVPSPDGRITGFLAKTPEEYANAMARVFRDKSVAQATSTSFDSNSERDVGEGSVTQPQVGGGAGGSGTACRGNETGGRGVVPEQQKVSTAGEQCCYQGVFSSENVRIAGRESARRFSNQVFDRAFAAEFVELLRQHHRSAFLGVSRFRSKRGKEE